MLRRPLAVALALAPLLATGCPSRKSTPTAPASSTSSATTSAHAPTPSTTTSASSSASAPLRDVPFSTLVSAEAWDEALRAIAALPEIERGSTSVRLARARASVGRCTTDDAKVALDDITSLRATKSASSIAPVLAALEVDALACAERWKEALAASAPHGLSSRTGARAQRTLARALEATGDFRGARDALDRALAGASSAGLSPGSLRIARLRLDRRLADESALSSDFRVLYVAHPRDYDAALAAGLSPPTMKLSAAHWLQRADALAGQGRDADATAAIDEAAKLGENPRKIARARGYALYRARAYAKAAPALAAASKLGADGDALEDAFHAARAKSRSGDDDGAIVEYEALARAHAGSRWGCEASYLAAQLRWLHGRWADSIDAYDRHLKGACARAPGQESNVREARRARAFALLQAGKLVDARKALRALAANGYERDSFSAARIELLEGIAAERADDKSSAIATYERLSSAHAWSYVDLVARARLARLGVTRAPWPSGPIAVTTPITLPEPASLLHDSGLDAEARARLPFGLARDDAGRCALAATLEAPHDAWSIGNRLDSSLPPDAARAWGWRCAFPTPWAPLVEALEAREGLPPGLLDAIVRQESAFLSSAVSPVGALGLAQLMPATAVATAKEAGVALDPDDVARIQSPWIQLDLAARHLASLYRELAPSADARQKAAMTPLVIAAYNAGGPAVKRWLGEAGSLDADLFLERIPFVETRTYVARVLSNLVRYSILRGAPPPTLPSTFAAKP